VTEHPLFQLITVRWRLFLREPSAVFWTYAFPLLLALALGTAFRNRPPEPIDAAVIARPGAERLRDALARDPSIHVRWLDESAAREALRTGKVSVVVDDGTPRSYRFDPTRPESRIARALVDDRLQRAAGRIDPTAVRDQTVTEPGSRYIDFLIPGLLGFNLMSSGLWGIGFVIVDMRARKLIKRFVATPMRRTHFLLSFVLVRAIFLLLELPVLIGFGHYVFDVPVRGSLVLITALATLGALVFAGMGLLVASRAQNTQTVGGLVNLLVLPMSITSGVFFSSARFPDAVQPLIRVLPLTALNDAVRAVMLDGASAAQVARPVLVLSAWGAVSFVAALKLFRWR
jgi:ABC-type multidrug transport system permease subunit